MTPMNNRLMRPRTRAPSGRTIYWSGFAGDSAWGTLGNWSNDAAGTVPAASLPGPADTAVLTGYVDTGAEPTPTIANLNALSIASLNVDLIVTGVATFSGNAAQFATLTGNAVFNEQSVNGGTINGNAVFNDTASQCGTVTGTVTVNGTPQPCP